MTDKPSYLESLLQQKEKMNAKLDEKIARARSKDRADDTRRKILFGAYMLHEVEKGNPTAIQLQTQLDGYLTKKKDREVFGLPELEQT